MDAFVAVLLSSGLFIIITIYLLSIYNRFKGLRNASDATLSQARANLGNAAPAELTRMDGEMRGLMGNIIAVAENYPVLKTSETVMVTMNAIKDIEDEIARHRYTYNNIIQEYNTMLDTIPSKFVGRSVGLRKKEYLDFFEEELKRPVVSWT
ncbi:MAG: LemA family protein [Candidatus Methanoperedens sp.]|nr:LemA family protein [Candidatus Methanoperedens sp.]MCE8427651.1 LemA family protein [Candidatus Methanoperedens sp.]